MSVLGKITVRELTARDAEAADFALRLLNRTQGDGFFAPTYLTGRFQKPDSYVIAAFRDDDELAGIAVADIIKNFDYYLPFDAGVAEELSSKVVGSFTTLSVVEKYQGQGIGQLLSRQRIEWLQKRRCDVAVGVSWVSGLAHTSNRTFERAGFRAVKKLDDFYHASSLANPFDCPGCHKIPCTCSAVFYRRDFSY